MALVPENQEDAGGSSLAIDLWRLSVTVEGFEDLSFKVPCGDGKLTVAELTHKVAERCQRLQPHMPVIVDKLTDHEGSLLFPEDRVMDVLENRGGVRAFIAGAIGAGRGDSGVGGGGVSKYTTAPHGKIKRRKVPVVEYKRDDAKYDYTTPTADELLAPGRVTGVLKYTCVVCEKRFAQLQQLSFHIRAHAGDERVAEAIAAADSGRTDTDLAAKVSKERRYFCCYPGCEHNPEHDPGAHPFKDYSNCRQHYLRRHTLEKPYSCAKCARGYSVKADMQTHRKHCGVRYACSCGQSFNSKRKLTLHLAAPHADTEGGGEALGVVHEEVLQDLGGDGDGGGDGGGGGGGFGGAPSSGVLGAIPRALGE